MGTNFIQHSISIGQAKTSRTIAVTTGVPQIITLVSSGIVLCNIQNIGATNVTLGDAGMPMGSGDTLLPFASREFYPISDNFGTYARAVSAASVIAVTEYKVA